MSESPEKNQMSVGNVCEFTANIIGGAKQANSARRASSARDSNQDVAKLEKEMSSREIRGTVQRRWTRADAKQRITWVRKLDPSVRKQLFVDFEQRHVNSNGAMWSIEGQPRDRYYEKRHDPLCVSCYGLGKTCRGKRARELLEESNPMCGTLPKQLRDPLTNAISFMINPAPFRGCCQFTLEVWEHAVYLEGELPCAFGKRSVGDCAPTVPLLTKNNLSSNMNGLRGFRPVRPAFEILFLVLRNITHLSYLDHETIRSVKPSFITISNLPQLSKVGPCFLSEHPSLNEAVFQSVHLQEAVFCNLPELTAVGDLWMDGCTYLRSITISNLPKLSKVGRCFLQGCACLKEVVFHDLPGLTEVGSSWMRECISLQSITISTLPQLGKVGDYFLSWCSSLKTAVFHNLPELTEVGDSWLKWCHALETVTISNLPKLGSVGQYFLAKCTTLQVAVFQDLPELTGVGHYWMCGCTALESITIRNLPKLEHVGVYFLHKCPSLKKAVLYDLPELTAEVALWIDSCTDLESVTIFNVPKMSKKGSTTCWLHNNVWVPVPEWVPIREENARRASASTIEDSRANAND